MTNLPVIPEPRGTWATDDASRLELQAVRVWASVQGKKPVIDEYYSVFPIEEAVRSRRELEAHLREVDARRLERSRDSATPAR